jgi:hypothetical protein
MKVKLTLNKRSDRPPLVGSASYMFGSSCWDSLIRFHPFWYSKDLSPGADPNTQWQGALTHLGDWCIFPDKLLCVQNRGETHLFTGRRGNSESCREEQGWAKIEFGHDISAAGVMFCHVGRKILLDTERGVLYVTGYPSSEPRAVLSILVSSSAIAALWF